MTDKGKLVDLFIKSANNSLTKFELPRGNEGRCFLMNRELALPCETEGRVRQVLLCLTVRCPKGESCASQTLVQLRTSFRKTETTPGI